MEEVFINHSDVVEAAVVAKMDELVGEMPVGFVVLKSGREGVDPLELEKVLVKMIRRDIGPIARLKTVMVLKALPKTRSGKILRNVLKGMVNGT